MAERKFSKLDVRSSILLECDLRITIQWYVVCPSGLRSYRMILLFLLVVPMVLWVMTSTAIWTVLFARQRGACLHGDLNCSPSGVYGRVAPRSGLAVKHGIQVGAGVIDPDLRERSKSFSSIMETKTLRLRRVIASSARSRALWDATHQGNWNYWRNWEGSVVLVLPQLENQRSSGWGMKSIPLFMVMKSLALLMSGYDQSIHRSQKSALK